MKKLVLVIDDDSALQTWLKETLPNTLFIVEAAATGREGLDLAQERKPDLILLDWHLPGWNGMEICRSIRTHRVTAHIPLIMLTGYAEVRYKTAAFNMGADDYITKPFELLELVARMKAVLRRHGPTPEDVLRIGDITMNLTTYATEAGSKPLKLTATEFHLLHMLMRNPGRTLTRTFLLERIWGYGDAISTRTVDVYIRRLRMKLGRSRASCIESVHNMGYKFKGTPQAAPPIETEPSHSWPLLPEFHRELALV